MIAIQYDGDIKFIRASHKQEKNICEFEHKNRHLNDLNTLNVEIEDITWSYDCSKLLNYMTLLKIGDAFIEF